MYKIRCHNNKTPTTLVNKTFSRFGSSKKKTKKRLSLCTTNYMLNVYSIKKDGTKLLHPKITKCKNNFYIYSTVNLSSKTLIKS
jgi:hypothetical protein